MACLRCKKSICVCAALERERAPRPMAPAPTPAPLVAIERTNGMVHITFHHKGVFAACQAAEAWCMQHGVSYGSCCGQRAWRGLLVGEYVIAKSRNLTPREIAQLHGRMYGDMRDGPVTIQLQERVVTDSMLKKDQITTAVDGATV